MLQNRNLCRRVNGYGVTYTQYDGTLRYMLDTILTLCIYSLACVALGPTAAVLNTFSRVSLNHFKTLDRPSHLRLNRWSDCTRLFSLAVTKIKIACRIVFFSYVLSNDKLLINKKYLKFNFKRVNKNKITKLQRSAFD